MFDGGEPLSEELWHPLRPPMIINPDLIPSLAEKFRSEFEKYKSMSNLTSQESEFLEEELGVVYDILKFAESNTFCIVTFLDKPFDEERASKVQFPIELNQSN